MEIEMAYLNAVINVGTVVIVGKIMFDVWDLCSMGGRAIQLLEELRELAEEQHTPAPHPVKWQEGGEKFIANPDAGSEP